MSYEVKSDDFIFGKKGGKLKPEIIQRLIRKIRNRLILPEIHPSFFATYFCYRTSTKFCGFAINSRASWPFFIIYHSKVYFCK